jgi:hypothetical protein
MLVHLYLQFPHKYPNCNLNKKISLLTLFFYDFIKGWKCSWHLTNIGYKNSLSYSSTRLTPSSCPTNENNIQRLLNLGSNLKEIMLWFFYFHMFLKWKERIHHTINFLFNVKNQQNQFIKNKFETNNWIIK